MKDAPSSVSDRPHSGYRRCVGILLLSRDGRVFVGRRRDTPKAWQMPQGGIDPGETPAAAASRELEEEIGTAAAELLAESEVWRAYDLPEALASRMWKGRYRGQTQRWVAMRFLGADADVRLDTKHPEFDAWQWVEPDRLERLIVPFKREVYLSVVAEFRHLWA